MFADIPDSLLIRKIGPGESEKNPDEDEETDADQLVYDRRSPPVKGEPFPFNPNTLTEKDWLKLGLRPKTVRTILNYLSKGGKFRNAEAFQKVYGLRDEEYQRLKPFIIIPPPLPHEQSLGKKPFQKNEYRPPLIIDINSADTSAFISLPGIGSKLASRIVSFREKLGGFYAIEQVREVYGLHDSVFIKIVSMLTLSSPSVKTIDINSATFELLSAHPYVRKEKAGMIINYRNEHGKFKSVDDLKNIHGISVEEFEKIKRYVIAD